MSIIFIIPGTALGLLKFPLGICRLEGDLLYLKSNHQKMAWFLVVNKGSTAEVRFELTNFPAAEPINSLDSKVEAEIEILESRLSEHVLAKYIKKNRTYSPLHRSITYRYADQLNDLCKPVFKKGP